MSEENKKPISFLLVDDDPHMLFFLKRTLQKENIPAEIDRLKNGEELVRFLEEQKIKADRKIDCILVDLNMPRKNGWETLTEIQAKKLGNNLPIIMFSHSKQSDIDRLKSLGAAAFLEKPENLDEYKAFVNKIVSYVSPGIL